MSAAVMNSSRRMMNRGKRKAHRKTARRASFLPWNTANGPGGGEYHSQQSHDRKSQLMEILQREDSFFKVQENIQTISTNTTTESPTTEQRKSRASSVLRQLYRLEKERKNSTAPSTTPGNNKIAPLSSIVRDSEEMGDMGIFSEEHNEKDVLSASQIAQLEELFELVDSDNSKSINLSDLIEFCVSHNMCGKKDAITMEEYVKEVSGYDVTKISFPEFSSIAIAFDLIKFDVSASQILTEREDRLKAGSPPGLSPTMQMAMGVGDVKRPSLVDRLVQAVTFKKSKGSQRHHSVLNHFNTNLMTLQNKNDMTSTEKPFYIFDQDNQKRLGWDFMILLLLVYTALWVPLRVGFEFDPPTGVKALELVVDLVFLADVVVNFLTSFECENGLMEYRVSAIALRYAKGWFWIDLISSIPFDTIASLAGTNTSNDEQDVTTMLSTLKVLKLLRILRALRVFSRLEEELNLQGRRPMKMIKICVGVLFIMHMFACGWAFMARQGEDYHLDSWVAQAELVNRALLDEYFFSLYWAVTTLTTVGYGDISPVNNYEVVFSTFAMMVGGALYGYVVALFATLMQGLDPNERMYHERMESIMCYMRHRKFPQKLFRQVTRYYTHFFKYKTALDEHSILEDLSFNLQQEVGEFLAQKFFVKTYLFSKFPFQLLIQLLGKLMPIKNGPDEVVFRMGQIGTQMFIVSIGNVFAFDSSGRVFFDFQSGAVFGEYTALGLLGGRLFHTQCRTMVEMCTLTAEDVEDVFGVLPHAMTDIVKRAKAALNMTVKKFKLQKRANMLKNLTRHKKHNSSISIDEDISIGRDVSIGQDSNTIDHSVDKSEEEIEEEEEEAKLEIQNEDENTEEEELPKIEDDTTNADNIKKRSSNSDLLRSIRNIIQAELQPLRRDMRKLKQQVRESICDDEELNDDSSNSKGSVGDYEGYMSRQPPRNGRGLHQRVRRNSTMMLS